MGGDDDHEESDEAAAEERRHAVGRRDGGGSICHHDGRRFCPAHDIAGTAGRARRRRDPHRSILSVGGDEVTRLVSEVLPGCQRMIRVSRFWPSLRI